MLTGARRVGWLVRTVARARSADGENERGSTSLELAILFPVLLLVITGLVQFGLWFHARSLALVAAEEGVTAARTYHSGEGAATARARQFLDNNAADTLADITVTASRSGAERIRVEVTGRALSILPGVPGPAVAQSAQGPVERFTTAGDP
ncbi:TadE family protein [Pengzhenrongella sp.]|jgi:Flp pilus assembly protein TadG|uniref:TadE family protein n=1 Tax=Pengzhenrongella sp. TaxID=2888820 RepID=UPI002F91D320